MSSRKRFGFSIQQFIQTQYFRGFLNSLFNFIIISNNFRFINVRKNGKEREEEEYSKRRLYQLKFCFTILENLITPSGAKDVYLVYENPDGTINTNFAEGYSGQFVHNNTEKNYTVKTTIDYNNSDLELCIPYAPEEENTFQSGLQYVSVYCDGRLIGQGNFMVK